MTLSRTLAAGALSTVLLLSVAPLQAHADPVSSALGSATPRTPTTAQPTDTTTEPEPSGSIATSGSPSNQLMEPSGTPENSGNQLEESNETPAPPQRAAQPTATAQPSTPPQKGVVYLNADVNVYDLAGKKIARSHVGDRIGSYGRNGKSNWWIVNYRGTQARIDVKYISGKPVAKYRNHLVWITNNSYVYDRASMSSRKVASIRRGKYVGTRGPTQGGWWPVNYRGRDAWIPKVVLSTSEIPAKTIVYATKDVAVKATASSIVQDGGNHSSWRLRRDARHAPWWVDPRLVPRNAGMGPQQCHLPIQTHQQARGLSLSERRQGGLRQQG